MPNYKPYNYNQDAMVVINYKEQLQPGTFEHAIHFLIENKKEWSGTFKELEEKQRKIKKRIRHCLKEHRNLDKSESSHQTQEARHQQTIDTLEQAVDKIDQFLKTQAPRVGQGKRSKEIKSNITDNESAKMTTSKGTIQGYNGVATVDKKHQIIVDAQAFGHGQEHHTLKPVLESLEARYRKLDIRKTLFNQKTIVTADTGFANEANMQYLHDRKINAYIPDNQFRSRDPRFQDQKTKHGKRHQNKPKSQKRVVIPASEFTFDPVSTRCVCPAGNVLSYRGVRENDSGQPTAYFEGRLLQCRHCPLKQKCMHNPKAADHRKGAGRQVSFAIDGKRKPTYTDWMKHRVDSDKGKWVYSHRLSTVEPVFGNIGTNKGLHRFSLRGKAKVQGQWQLYCMIHNIEKLKNYGRLG